MIKADIFKELHFSDTNVALGEAQNNVMRQTDIRDSTDTLISLDQESKSCQKWQLPIKVDQREGELFLVERLKKLA